MKSCNSPMVGLISMPWMLTAMPSIQLAVLATALQQEGIESESHELYLDYAAYIGLNLYDAVYMTGGIIEEWLFAQHYFGPEAGNMLAGFRTQGRPSRLRLRLGSRALEEQVLDALIPVTASFLEETAAKTDWSRYDIIGFSLTTSQLASSMALARLIKIRYPETTIIFGGTQCAGLMGSAILRICPYVDVVVRVEGEAVLPELVRRIRNHQDFDLVPGVSWRATDGNLVINPKGPLHTVSDDRPHLRYDGYFERLTRLGLSSKVNVWLPFEGSRGCWYGEKVRCTFCGIHETMKYRDSKGQYVLAELEDWYQRYGINRFFAVDLIMPRDFLTTFLPEIIHREHDWLFFYQVKANLKRSEVEVLARAGVRWLQPGIESLDQEILKLMKKGASPLHNIQLLKWCQEMNIHVLWNFIFGFPGESATAYTRIAERIQLLWHLMPPVGGGPFQLHRFSPYFDHPEMFGIKRLGPYSIYKYIFPVSTADLDDLIYFHDYTLEGSIPPRTYIEPVEKAVRDWKAAWARGASLTFSPFEDGSAEILDTRTLPETTYHLTPSEALLYHFLDAATVERTLGATFSQTYPLEAQKLAKSGGIEAIIDDWRQQGLVISDHGRVLALAVNTLEAMKFHQGDFEEVSMPFPYLSERTVDFRLNRNSITRKTHPTMKSAQTVK